MGQAKNRGSKEDRLKEATTPPQEGIYVATKLDAGYSVYVSDVSDPEDGFFVLTVINAIDKDDPSAISDEITSDEWFSFARRYGMRLSKAYG